jgi:hypothetical protein
MSTSVCMTIGLDPRFGRSSVSLLALGSRQIGDTGNVGVTTGALKFVRMCSTSACQ